MKTAARPAQENLMDALEAYLAGNEDSGMEKKASDKAVLIEKLASLVGGHQLSKKKKK